MTEINMSKDPSLHTKFRKVDFNWIFIIITDKIVFFGNFLGNDFWTPPPPINFVHASYNKHMDQVGHVDAEPGPLACPSRGARPPSLS